MFEKNISSQVLVKVKKTVFRSLNYNKNTSPCCWKISMCNLISKIVNHLAMGAIILPRIVDFIKVKWFTIWQLMYISSAHMDWSNTIFEELQLPLLDWDR